MVLEPMLLTVAITLFLVSGGAKASFAPPPSPPPPQSLGHLVGLDERGLRDLLNANSRGHTATAHASRLHRLKLLDSDDDGVLSWAEYTKDTVAVQEPGALDALDAAFQFADMNNDGRLLLASEGGEDEEFSAASVATLSSVLDSVLLEQVMASVLQAHDKDRNGQLSVVEHCPLQGNALAEDEGLEAGASSVRSCVAVDRNGDGELDRSEIESAFLPSLRNDRARVSE